MKTFLFLTFIFLFRSLQAQIVMIPTKEQMEGADAVVNFHSTTFEVLNLGESETTEEAEIMILNEKGSHFAKLQIPFSKLEKVSDVEAKIYNSFGKELKKLKKGDIVNRNFDPTIFVTDRRYKIADLTQETYPYFIKYKIISKSKNLMFYQNWSGYPENRSNTAVIKSTFKIIVPKELGFRHKTLNLKDKPTISSDEKKDYYSWEVSNLKPFKRLSYEPDDALFLPMVLTAPNVFSVEEFENQPSKSWNDLGRFMHNLNLGRQDLPEELASKIKELTKNEKSNEAKVKKVYHYLQSTTRYMNISLGIGGWQTQPASEVAERGFGDCKALTNYTQALLKSIGIPSHQVLVRAGDHAEDIISDFPSFQFNHVFLCVPNGKDSLWLECTSQNNPLGYLGTFTSDRHVFLLDENGGKIIKTPTYTAQQNLQVRKASIKIPLNQIAEASLNMVYLGLQADDYMNLVNHTTQEDQRKTILRDFNVAGLELQNFKFALQNNSIPRIDLEVKSNYRNLFSKAGSRLLLNPNFLNAGRLYIPVAEKDRTLPFNLPMNYCDIDTIEYNIPVGYKIEALPEAKVLKSEFGQYESKVVATADKITYYRWIKGYKNSYTADKFPIYIDYIKKVSKADNGQIVFVPNE
ncbi:MAG: DUF3857 domain-containing protein [Leadbetterella sp.]